MKLLTLKRTCLSMLIGLASIGIADAAHAQSTSSTNQSTNADVPLPAASVPGESAYDRQMRLGYAASLEGNYAEARQHFRQALAAVPNDRLATIAYWNMVNAQRSQSTPTAQPVSQTTSSSEQTLSQFDYYMNRGYAATKIDDYETALSYFQQARQLRPNSTYARQAIRNVTTYMEESASTSSEANTQSQPSQNI